ncbi:MAG: hypothetical protein HXY22_06300 [Alphaproteobacteria bacterium]|nr:hypothetical protein [Alphaproteobacteria bacterium]
MSFDVSLITSYYTAQTALKLARSGTASTTSSSGSASNSSDVPPPWDVSSEHLSADEKFTEAMTKSIAVNEDNSSFTGATDDEKKLFALYQALDTLSALAAKASDEDTSAYLLSGLDRRFQEGLTNITDYLSTTTFEGVEIVLGESLTRAESGVGVAKQSADYVGGIAVRGSHDNPIDGLTGSEVLTIQVEKSTGTFNIDVDLSEISGDITLDAVADLANSKLEAAGLLTRLSRTTIETNDDGIGAAFGLTVKGVSTEVVSFSAASSEPAIYVAGQSGTGDITGGQLLKFTDLDDPTEAARFRAAISSEDGSITPTATVVDADGNVYVVGTAAGDVEGKTSEGAQDVFLQKYDSTGKLLWSDLVGASGSASDVSIAVTSDGGVVLAGQIDGDISSSAIGGKGDSFVVKYNADGSEAFTRQIAPSTEDGATSVAVGADGSIYVGGYTKGKLSGVSATGGGADAYVTKLSADGELVYNRQFGGTGDERVQSLAVDENGDLVVASLEDGEAVLRKFSSADSTSSAIWEKSLGEITGGSIGQVVTASGGRIYVAGSTANASLTAGGEASVANASSGALEGFVMQLDDAGSSVTADHVTYVGTSRMDRIAGIAVAGNEVYVTGDTIGAFAGYGAPLEDSKHGFVSRIDENGAIVWTRQFSGTNGSGTGAAIAVDTTGSSVVDILGLPSGEINTAHSRLLTANSSLRAGDSFYLAVDGGTNRRIRIEEDETMRSLAQKINGVLLTDGKAEVRRIRGEDRLVITMREGHSADLSRGPSGSDALSGLGFTPVRITASSSSDDDDDSSLASFALKLSKPLSLSSTEDAASAVSAISDAMSAIRSAYRELTKDPALEAELEKARKKSGTVSAYQQSQLANYQAGLARLQATSTSTSTSGFF